ncbi:hypothetical protein DFH29DRAFT_614038 [Suillus ampliporus]|nr:hypothetical protein DFH29DRAFT_614038 [Suillus ampliporus]
MSQILPINTDSAAAEELFIQEIAKLNSAADTQIRKLREYVVLSEAEGAIRNTIHVQLETAPLHLLNTATGLLCARELQIRVFEASTEYNELLLWCIKHPDL